MAWARASRSSSVLAGVVTALQSSPASRSAAAWPSIRAVIAAEVRRVALTLPLAVAVKDRLGVGVAVAPPVRVVGVHRLVGGEPLECPEGQLLERAGPAWEAAQQLRGRVRSLCPRLEALAFERALVGLRGPTAQGPRRYGSAAGVPAAGVGLVMRVSS